MIYVIQTLSVSQGTIRYLLSQEDVFTTDLSDADGALAHEGTRIRKGQSPPGVLSERGSPVSVLIILFIKPQVLSMPLTRSRVSVIYIE